MNTVQNARFWRIMALKVGTFAALFGNERTKTERLPILLTLATLFGTNRENDASYASLTTVPIGTYYPKNKRGSLLQKHIIYITSYPYFLIISGIMSNFVLIMHA